MTTTTTTQKGSDMTTTTTTTTQVRIVNGREYRVTVLPAARTYGSQPLNEYGCSQMPLSVDMDAIARDDATHGRPLPVSAPWWGLDEDE